MDVNGADAAIEFRFARPELANMIVYIDKPKTRQYLVNPDLLKQLVQKLQLSRRHSSAENAINIEPHPTISLFNDWLKNLARCVSYMTPPQR